MKKLCTLSREPIELEEGDLIAIDNKTSRLWVRDGDNLYISSNPVGEEIPNPLTVSSSGRYSMVGNILLPKNIKWEEYSCS